MKHLDFNRITPIIEPFLTGDRHLRDWQLEQVKFEFFRALYTLYFSTPYGNTGSVTIPSEFIEQVQTGNLGMRFRMRNILRHSLIHEEAPPRRHRIRFRRHRAKDPILETFPPKLSTQSR